MDVTVYTKENCDRCQALKSFLNTHNIPYTEKNIMDQEVANELLRSEYVIKNFCSERGCIVITPIVKLDDTWIHREFFDINGFSEKRAMKIFNLF